MKTATNLAVELTERDGRTSGITLAISQLLLVGYTGRDREKVLEHVRELEAIGVAPPPRIPMIYEVAPSLLTTTDAIQVETPETSGEVEFVLIDSALGLLVGVGSDHTDRHEEAIDVPHSKALCPKPIGSVVWRYEDVRDHWDRLQIRSWVTHQDSRDLYQDGEVGSFMRVDAMLDEVTKAGYPDQGHRLIFGGTVPTADGFVYGDQFEAELHDPILRRSLRCAYHVRTSGARVE